MKFHPWTNDDDDDGLAWSEDLPDELDERGWELCEGSACASWFPNRVTFQLAPDAGQRLADSIPNVLALLLASTRLRNLLESESRARIEWLPIRLRDRKRRRVKEDYHLANVLDVVECVDRKRSVFNMQQVIKDQVHHFHRLVLDAAKIPRGQRTFRLAEKKSLVLVREDLARIIQDAGCTGMSFPDLEDYGAEYRG